MRRLCVLPFLLSCLSLGRTWEVSVKKCCPDGQALDEKTNDCRSGTTLGPFVELTGLNFNKSIHDPVRTVPINVTFAETGKPKTSDTLERHLFRTGKDMTRYGESCTNACGQHGDTEYFWCNTKTSWDYCSPDHKHTIYNQSCAYNCAKDGASYYWCKKEMTEKQMNACVLENTDWDYCSPGKESETWLTVDGKLVTSRYETEFDHGDFCVDKVSSEGGEMVALMKDPCEDTEKGSKHCLNLCCPHGHIQKNYKCVKHDETIDWNPEFWDETDRKIAQERNTHYILSAPTKSINTFTCPKNRDYMETETDLADWKLHFNGTLSLKGTFTNVTEEYQTNEFCMIYGDPFDEYNDEIEYGDYKYNYEQSADENKTLEKNFMKCNKREKEKTSTNVRRALYPPAIGISAAFLFVVLVIMYLEPSLRKGLFGRITVGFVANVFVGYIIICFGNNGEIFAVGSSPCVASGYIQQYTFLAFFFWVNAMAINIFIKFSRANQFGQSSQDERKKFWYYFAYAQGGPLVICIITAMVDHFGYKSACQAGFLVQNKTALLPNMGEYSCFLGSGQIGRSRSFFAQPDFLYFQLFLIIIQILNIAFFGTTIHYLNQHWKETNQILDKSKEKRRENVFVVIKLFFIMGIPWIFEIISSLIKHNHGDEEWFHKSGGFAINIILDIPNLFTGFLIFLVLVCKRTIFESLRAKIMKSSPDTTEMATKVTVMSEVPLQSSNQFTSEAL